MSIHLSSPVLVHPQMELAWLRKKHSPTPAGHNLSLGLLTARAIDASCDLYQSSFSWALIILPCYVSFSSSYSRQHSISSSSILTLYWLPDFCFHKNTESGLRTPTDSAAEETRVFGVHPVFFPWSLAALVSLLSPHSEQCCVVWSPTDITEAIVLSLLPEQNFLHRSITPIRAKKCCCFFHLKPVTLTPISLCNCSFSSKRLYVLHFHPASHLHAFWLKIYY